MGIHSKDRKGHINISRTHLTSTLNIPLEDRESLRKHISRLKTILDALNSAHENATHNSIYPRPSENEKNDRPTI